MMSLQRLLIQVIFLFAILQKALRTSPTLIVAELLDIATLTANPDLLRRILLHHHQARAVDT